MSLSLIGFPLAALVAWAGLFYLRRVAPRVGLVDIPNHRSLHATPTPRGGGLIIPLCLLPVWLLLALRSPEIGTRAAMVLFFCGMLIAGVGLRDDVAGLSARIRFLAQLLAAGAVLAVGEALPGIPLSTGLYLPLGPAGFVLSMVWIVGLTNAYNFMDGSDGIAGLQALWAGLGWAAAGLILGVVPLVAIGAVLAGASAGFLLHNWQPARIFMGDVGSLFIGFILAALPVLVPPGMRQPTGVEARSTLYLAAFLFVWPFVLDAGYTFLRRLRNRENVFAAHRSHLYQRLALTGLSHAAVARIYGALAATGLVAASSLLRWGPALLLPILAVIGILFGTLVVMTRRREARVAVPPTLEA